MEPILFGPKGLRLGEWEAEGRVRVVKQAAHRVVYHVELPQGAFYVKRYRRDRLPDAIGQLFRPSAARREWRKAAELARRGVPTATPVAWTEYSCGGLVRDNCLVTKAIEPACSLERYVAEELPKLEPHLGRAVRRRLVEGLARFMAAVHRAGIAHDDFHVGNVLVRPGLLRPADLADSAGPHFYLIDVPGVRFRGPLGWRASRASLVMLAAGCWERTSLAERARFWRTYLRQRPDLNLADRRRTGRQIAQLSRAYSRRVSRRRDKRALRTNRDFVALRASNGAAHGVVDLAPDVLRRFLDQPEELLWENLHRPVKLGHSKLIVQAELPLEGGPIRVALARCRYRNRWKALWGWFLCGRALRGWCMGHALLARGIATARPIAVCQIRRGCFRSESYLATQWIDGSENLHQFGWRLARLSPPDRHRRTALCAESLGALIGRMHAHGITHGDLKAANVLIVEQKNAIQAYLIDAEDVRIARRLGAARRAADLARLAASLQAHSWVPPAILLRFLRAYASQFPPGVIAWKRLWREVARRSARIVRRKRRRGEEVL